MFVSLVLYKDAYLACHAGGDENELLILLFINIVIYTFTWFNGN